MILKILTPGKKTKQLKALLDTGILDSIQWIHGHMEILLIESVVFLFHQRLL